MAQFPLHRQDMEDMTYLLPTAEQTLRGNTITALVTAALANQDNGQITPITTSAITIGSVPGPVVEKLWEELGSNGFTVNQGSTTFTVSF
jgi:hypothetical protein